MKLFAKVLQGPMTKIEVDPTDNILKVKQLLEGRLEIPVGQQKVVYQGKPLSDSSTVRECGLADGNRVYVVKQKDSSITSGDPKTPSVTKQTSEESAWWKELRRFLHRHFTKENAELVLHEYKKVDPTDNILKVKQLLEGRLEIPVGQQKVVYQGKPLSDSSTVRECGLADGNRVYVVKQKDSSITSGDPKTPSVTKQTSEESAWWKELRRFLHRHFTKENAELVLHEYKKVDPTDNILKVKQLLEGRLEIPVGQQKVVYQGKPLSDSSTVRECGLADGNRVYVVKQKDSSITSGDPKTPSVTKQTSEESAWWKELRRFLHRHFTKENAELVLHEYKKDLNKTLNGLNLDDIERFATAKLNGTRMEVADMDTR